MQTFRHAIVSAEGAPGKRRRLRLRRSHNILAGVLLRGGGVAGDMENALQRTTSDWVLFDHVRAGPTSSLDDDLGAVRLQFDKFCEKQKHTPDSNATAVKLFQIDGFVHSLLRPPSKTEKLRHRSVHPFILAAKTGRKEKAECVGFAKAFALMCRLLSIPHTVWASETHVFVTVPSSSSASASASASASSSASASASSSASSSFSEAFVLCVNRKTMNKLNKIETTNFSMGRWKTMDSMYALAVPLHDRDVIALTIVNEISDPIRTSNLLQTLGPGGTPGTIWEQQARREAEVARATQRVFANANIPFPMAALDAAKMLLDPRFLHMFLNSIDEKKFRYPAAFFVGNTKDDDNEDFIGVFKDILLAERLEQDDADAMWTTARAKALAACEASRHKVIAKHFDALKSPTSAVAEYLHPLSGRRGSK